MKKQLINKKYLIYIFVLIFIAILGISFAFYSSNDTFVNEFKSMTYDVKIEEEFNNDWGTKKVFFSNEDQTNTPVVLRINYNESWTKDSNGILLVLSNEIDGTNVVTKTWTNVFLNDFEQGEDGWYYYKKVLNAGDRIQVLESIALNNELTDGLLYQYYDYELDFNYEAIQASSNAITEIWGKTATISGGNVTWQ